MLLFSHLPSLVVTAKASSKASKLGDALGDLVSVNGLLLS
tara:strand:- start:229 stop:348 length:120 start_codon:yes stop_codon:yes gene_type:complete